MASLAEDIAIYLTSNSLVQGYGIDVFSDCMPETPSNLVSIFEYVSDPISVFVDAVHRSLQFQVRDEITDNSKALALKIYKALLPKDESNRVDLTAERFGQVYVRQIPFKLKEDENNRTIYCFNIGVTTTID